MSEWGDKLLTEADNARLRAENAELRDENARLRSCLSDDVDNARQIMAENTKLQEQGERLFDKTLDLSMENAKLRKLVRDITEAFIHGNCYRWCEAEPCNFIIDGKCQFLDRMRELGVKL